MTKVEVTEDGVDQSAMQMVWLRPWRRTDFVIVVVAAVVGLLVTRLILGAGLTGWPVVVWLLACVVIVPTARELSTRVVYNVVLLCAITYLDWLIGVPLPGTHGARLLGLATALGFASIAVQARGLIRQTLPAVKAIDILPPFLVVSGAPTALRHWYVPKSAADIYGTIAYTWDNTSHYYLVNVMHSSQAMTRRLPTPPDGSENGFVPYPVGYHSWTASLLDLWSGSQPLSPVPQAAAFLQVTALVTALTVLLIGCAVAAIPAIRRSTLTGCFAVSLTISLLLFGPGFWSIVDAHYNFQFAIGMAFVAFAISVSSHRLFEVLPSTVLLAAILCAGGAWLPMGALAALAAIGVFWPLEPTNFKAPRAAKIWVCLVAALVFVATAIPAGWARGEFAGQVFTTATGGITAVPALLLAVMLIALVMTGIFADREPSKASQRIKMTSIAMFILLAGFAIWQTVWLRAHGEIAMKYYPQKLLNGIGLVSCLIGIVSTAVIFHRSAPAAKDDSNNLGREMLRFLAVVATGFGCFGLTLAPALGLGGVPGDVIAKRQLAEPRPDLVRACEVAHRLPPGVVGVVVGPNQTDTLTCAAERGLYTTLTGRLNAKIMDKRDEDVVNAIRDELLAGRAVLIVDPVLVENYRTFAGPGLSDRILPW